MIQRILVATDRSETATRAVEWAAEMAARYSAELLVLQVVAPEHVIAVGSDGPPAADELREFTERLAGARGRVRLEYDPDPAQTILRVAEEERADVVVVGSRSMRQRGEFLRRKRAQPRLPQRQLPCGDRQHQQHRLGRDPSRARGGCGR